MPVAVAASKHETNLKGVFDSSAEPVRNARVVVAGLVILGPLVVAVFIPAATVAVVIVMVTMFFAALGFRRGREKATAPKIAATKRVSECAFIR